MSPEQKPTLVDDEAKLAEYATALADAVNAVALLWLQRLVDTRAPGMGSMAPVVAELGPGAETTIAEMRVLLALDIGEQTTGPLEILRRATRFATGVLASAGVAPVDRDEFAARNFPDDVYNLTPASFADVDPSLHEPGLTWGAAKAHVHLRRRREAAEHEALTAPPEQKLRVVALSADLMDRSKISAAFPDASMVRSVQKLLEAAPDADVIFVDLARVDDPQMLTGVEGRVIGFGSHVNEAVLAAAEAAGIEALPRSVFFRRLETLDL